MYDQPDAAALLDIVAELLRETVVPQLSGAVGYQARIAANLVAIATREIRAAPADHARELASLQQLLATDGDLVSLNRELAGRLADGRLSFDSPGVTEHLHRTTMAKIVIDQPTFARLTTVG